MTAQATPRPSSVRVRDWAVVAVLLALALMPSLGQLHSGGPGGLYDTLVCVDSSNCAGPHLPVGARHAHTPPAAVQRSDEHQRRDSATALPLAMAAGSSTLTFTPARGQKGDGEATRATDSGNATRADRGPPAA
jgi:hypothetical protein